MRVILMVLLSTSSLTGCGDSAQLQPDAPSDAALPDVALQERIDDAVMRISADTCFAQQDTSGCEWANYEVAPSHFNMAVSTGEAILVVDDLAEGMYPQLVRYRNRVLGFYRINSEQLEPQTLSVRLPKQLGDAVISFADPHFIPAGQLSAVATAVGNAYKNVRLLGPSHGGVVLAHLIELAPEQPLVLLHSAELLRLLPSLCTATDDQALVAARAHFTGLATSLRQVMRAHNVRFVNASFGDTATTLAADWARTCGDTVPVPSSDMLRQLLHLYDPIYDALFNTDGVLTAHASANLGDPADFPFDQVSSLYPNRSRVGFISSLNSGLDELGRGAVQKAEQFPLNNSDADVFVNWGCVTFGGCADPHYEMAGDFGLGMLTLPLMTPSYVTPLGLGRLINLRYANHATEPMSNTLIQALRRELTPSLCGDGAQCIYQDPIAHRQLEIYRQHYR